jgi:hypothetical protein
MARIRDPTGVREQGMWVWGSPRNLGGPVISADSNVVGEATNQRTPVWGRGADTSRRDEQRALGRYRQTKATKRGGKDGRESEQFVVAVKAGN